MANSKDDVKRLREETGAGVMDCKRALDEEKADFSKAKTLIKERGLAKAKEKADREAKEGVVEAYVHAGGRIGAMVELSSETDFVARNPDFRELAKEIAMQVAAMDPKDLDELLEQAYIRDASKTIGELVTGVAATTGENVRVKRFKRFELGQSNGEPTLTARDGRSDEGQVRAGGAEALGRGAARRAEIRHLSRIHPLPRRGNPEGAR